MYKIIGADGKEYGPITTEQLRQWIAEGRANAQTKVLPEGTSEWKTLADFPEFVAATPSSPPTLPTSPVASAAAPSAREQVNGPAIGLIVVAILGFLAAAGGLVANLVGASLLSYNRMPNQAWAQMFSGTLGVISNAIGILVSGLILMGGIKMKKLESHGLAMAASIVAMIPCISPCCLAGLPIGIWALVILAKPEVKSAFH